MGGKGRPARRTAHGDIKVMALGDKLKVLTSSTTTWSTGLWALSSSTESGRAGERCANKKEQKHNVRHASDITPANESTSPVLMSQLDDRAVHMLANRPQGSNGFISEVPKRHTEEL